MTLFRWLTTAALVLCFVVVVFGAYVRLSNAGLGCPDWPGCYGRLAVPTAAAHVEAAQQQFPGRPVVAHKAWKEMIHRYLASTLGLLILGLFALSFRADCPHALPKVLLALVIFQGLLGMWTVTWLLKPVVVTAHLLGGMATLGFLCWLFWENRASTSSARTDGGRTPSPFALSLSKGEPDFRNEREAFTGIERATDLVAPGAAPAGLKGWALVGAALVLCQIFLGGWTSSNYAALACPDLPGCQGRLWPEMDLREAFTLSHGDVNYEHGVLNNRARVTIHYVHRIGALVVGGFLALLGSVLWRRRGGWHRFGIAICTVLGVQVLLGASLIVFHWPLPLAAAHNAGAALLWLTMISLNHFARRQAT